MTMRGNIPIPELPPDVETWLIVAVTNVREGTTRNGAPFITAVARNASGSIPLRIWSDAIDPAEPLVPGLWGIEGRRETFERNDQFIVTRYRSVTIDKYREHQHTEPPLPSAYTIDIETVALPEYRDRVPGVLERNARLGKMRIEQIERYAEDADAEIDRVYALGSLSATSGRIVSIAVHVAPLPEFAVEGHASSEYVFGINEDGQDEGELRALQQFFVLLEHYDREVDEIVGHNVLDFDLPFIYQRALVNELRVPRLVNLSEYTVRGVYDTQRAWWLGQRKTVSLDEIAFALGLVSSKTKEVEGSTVYELFHAGRLADIREYNLKDIRLTRHVYERLVSCLGR